MSMNAKRADLVVCDAATNPVLVIEYQGTGHYGPTPRSRRDAKRRDAQKRRALAEAGVTLLEMPATFDEASARAMLAAYLGPADEARVGRGADRTNAPSSAPRLTR